MNRLWSLLFLLVPLLGVGVYVWSAIGKAPLATTWLPENLSRQGQTIDSLFLLIHYLAAALLMGTGLVLAFSLWRFRDRPGARAHFVHTKVGLEIAWTIVPAAILIWLSLYQWNAWADNKLRRPTIPSESGTQVRPPLARIVAKQFGWEVYYPGSDGKFDTPDDLYVENELYIPVDQDVVLELRSRDVIHDFFVPQLRLKQDIVPGSTQYLWFRTLPQAVDRRLDFVCAELCGWGHYKMNGWLYIVTPGEFDQRMAELAADRRAGLKAEPAP
jgi:cytochrome c oxidase subunit 2